MVCKSCYHSVNKSDKFCSNCGGKIVKDRISLKGTLKEFIVPYFNLDNNFWNTYKVLFTNPKDVLEAYISGARKKYFKPFSYLLLYATIAVIYYKVFPYSENQFFTGFKIRTSINNDTSQELPINSLDIVKNIINYYNFIIILTIPFYSLITYITFIKKGNNYAEHLVFNSYLQANIGYVSIITQILFLSLFNLPTLSYNLQFLFSIFFSVYIFVKLYQLNVKQTIIAFSVYWLLLIISFILLILAITALLFVFNKI